MKRLLPLLILISCGTKEIAPAKPRADYPELRAQVERVEPQLLWCDGGVAFPRKNNVTKQPLCDVGDSVSTTGAVYGLGKIGNFSIIDHSIETDGRPWRHPSYVNRDTNNSFSRDAFIGAMEATFASKKFAPLKRLQSYVSRTGKLCPDATDNKCDLTPSVKTLLKYVTGQKVGVVERELDENTILAEVHTAPPGYRAYLTARKLRLIHITGHSTAGYGKSVTVLNSRFPNSFYVRILYAMYFGKSFDTIAKDLAECLSRWEKTGKDWFGDAIEKGCTDKHHGADLVSLGKYLLE
jgi:hypothetical protein